MVLVVQIVIEEERSAYTTVVREDCACVEGGLARRLGRHDTHDMLTSLIRTRHAAAFLRVEGHKILRCQIRILDDVHFACNQISWDYALQSWIRLSIP